MNDRNTEDDWVETLTKLAGSVGFNPVRVRWKLTQLRKSWTRTERVAEQKVQHIQYEHKVCPVCGRVNDRYAVRCVGCAKPLSSRAWQVFERIGVTMPDLLSVSSLLGLALMGVYAYMMVKYPGEGYGGWSGAALIRHGANWSPATFGGQWWRLATYAFVHIGLWHLGFNLLALAQIGPAIEKVFGRGRMLFFFMLTAVFAGLASVLLGRGLAAGASGAVMGLIGVGAGWGHRDGSAMARGVRNLMLKWAAYTMVFGIFMTMSGAINVDNYAHGGGFLLGALLGYLTPPAWVGSKSTIGPGSLLLGLIGAAAAIASVYLVIVPPKATEVWVASTTQVGSKAVGYMVINQACALRDAGARDKAAKKLAEMARFGLMLSGTAGEDPVDSACEHAAAMRSLCAAEPVTPPELLEQDDDDGADEEGVEPAHVRQVTCAAVRMAEGWKKQGYY